MPTTTAQKTSVIPLVRVRLPSTLATRAGVDRLSEVRAETVGAGLAAITALHPALAPLIWLGAGELNPNVMVFHNEALVRDDNLDNALEEGDMIDVVPAVESG
jgi:molybdopterin converting factor small subunit